MQLLCSTQERVDAPHLPPHVPHSDSMLLLAPSGTSGVLQQVGALKLPLSVTQAFERHGEREKKLDITG